MSQQAKKQFIVSTYQKADYDAIVKTRKKGLRETANFSKSLGIPCFKPISVLFYLFLDRRHAPITKAEDGSVTFDTPVAMPGAVSISLDPTGEPESFYADGVEYYVINNNQGYDGDLELAMIPESFRTDILKEEQDANKVLVENSNSETGSFALLF